jgi:uncharacterized RDD family membrane protein YckC
VEAVALSRGNYGGFLERFGAIVIDAIVLSVAIAILTIVTFGSGGIVWLFGPWIYEALMLSSAKQATLGKMALGLVVTDIEGRKLSFGRATGRHFAKYISAFILGIGFIMAAFTEKKQALHDMIAQTLVVNGKR